MKRDEVATLSIDGLRPIVQRGLKLTDWPGDWDTVGKIFTDYRVTFQKYSNNDNYECIVWMEYANGSGIDLDPLTAIFRAYVIARWNEADVEKSMQSKTNSGGMIVT